MKQHINNRWISMILIAVIALGGTIAARSVSERAAMVSYQMECSQAENENPVSAKSPATRAVTSDGKRWTDFASTSFSGGTGKQDDPYLITTAGDLALLAKNVNNGNFYKGSYFKQTADIDLGAHYWTAISYKAPNLFFAEYDGCGYRISNLTTIENGVDSYGYGLFGYSKAHSTSDGRTLIKNVVIDGINIQLSNVGSKQCRVGGIIAIASSGCDVQNCSVIRGTIKMLNVTTSQNNIYVGGIVADMAKTLNNGDDFGSTSLVPQISNCFVNADIQVTNTSGDGWTGDNNYQYAVGGIVGRIRGGNSTPDNATNVLPSNCMFTGSIEAHGFMVSPSVGCLRKNVKTRNVIYASEAKGLVSNNLFFANLKIMNQNTWYEIHQNQEGFYKINGSDSTPITSQIYNGYTCYVLETWDASKPTDGMVSGINHGREGTLEDMLEILNEAVTPENGYVGWIQKDDVLYPSNICLTFEKDVATIDGTASGYIVWTINGEEKTDNHTLTYPLTETEKQLVDGTIVAVVYATEADKNNGNDPICTLQTIYYQTPAGADINDCTVGPNEDEQMQAAVQMPSGYEDVGSRLYYKWYINGTLEAEGTGLQTYVLTPENLKALDADLSVQIFKYQDDETPLKDTWVVTTYNAGDYINLKRNVVSTGVYEIASYVKENSPAIFDNLGKPSFPYLVTYAWTLDGVAQTNSTGASIAVKDNGRYELTMTLTPKTGQPAYLTQKVYTASFMMGMVVFIDPSGDKGNDDNDGLTEDTPVKTMTRAYQLLRKSDVTEKTMENCFIVLMSDYSCNESGIFAAGMDPGLKKLNNDVNCTITGQFSGKNYKSAFKLPASGSNGILLSADTKFEYLTFKGISTSSEYGIFACGNNLTFGYGLKMDLPNSQNEGAISSHFYDQNNQWRTCCLEVTMGFNVPTALWGSYDADGNYQSPATNSYDGYHGFDPAHPCTFTMHSGAVGRLLGSCRSKQVTTVNRPDQRVFASKAFPFYVDVIIDIPKEEQLNRKNTGQLSDIGNLIMGQADGSCFVNASLTIKNGRVGRVVGGNLGWADNSMTTAKNSFLGTTTIRIEDGAEINELYGGTLGRAGDSQNVMAYPAYYGHIKIDMVGGDVTRLYAVGAGGLTGYSPKSSDPFRETWGHTFMKDHPLGSTSSVSLNMTGGTIHDAIYGGGYGRSNLLKDELHPRDAGTLYGNSSISITGGTVIGNVYAAGSGVSTLKGKTNLSGELLDSIAQLYGTTRLDIAGTTVIKGDVYGGGMGIEGAPLMAKLFGSSEVHIGGTAVVEGSVYGGGALSSVIGTTGVYIGEDGGTPTIYKNIFGGGKGSQTQQAEIVVDPSLGYTRSICKVHISGGKFKFDNASLNEASNCVFGGGDINCKVDSSDVEIRSLLIPEINDSQYKNLYGSFGATRFHIFGGGLGEQTFTDHTEVKIDLPKKVTAQDRNYLDVYGGGFRGLTNVTNVTVGSIDEPFSHTNNLRYIFGGAYRANVGTGVSETDAQGKTVYSNLTGRTNVTVYNCNVDRVYGGGYLGDVMGNTTLNFHGGSLQHVYGGGEAASVRGNATVTLNRMITVPDGKNGTTQIFNPIPLEYTYAIFGGGHGDNEHSADVDGAVTVNVMGSYYQFINRNYLLHDDTYPLYSIYGGCNYRGVVGSTHVTVSIPDPSEAHTFTDATGTLTKESTSAIADYIWQQFYNNDEISPVSNIYGGGYGAQTEVSGNTLIEIPQLGLHNYMNIFGGGERGIVNGDTHIIVGRDGETYTEENFASKNVMRNIYGGGLKADVNGSTTIDLLSGYMRSVFGGGRNGNVLGNTQILTFLPNNEDNPTTGTLDVTIDGDVYGGCELAVVGGIETTAYGNTDNSGNVLVRLQGNVRVRKTLNVDGTTHGGNVYGGGRGFQDNEDLSKTVSADLTTSNVLIKGPNSEQSKWKVEIQGNIYGGGNTACHQKRSFVQLLGAFGDINNQVNDYADTSSDKYESNIENRKTLWEQTLTNVYGGGYGTQTSVDDAYTAVGALGQTTTTLVGNIFGGGEGGNVGDKASAASGYPYKTFTKFGDNTSNTTQQNVGRTHVYILPGTLAALNIYGGCNKSAIYGNTRVNMLGGTIGTKATVTADFGNCFGGSNTGFVYGNTTVLVGKCYYKINAAGFYTFISLTEYEALSESDKADYSLCEFDPERQTTFGYCSDIKIMNALFGGGNISGGTTSEDKKVYANTETVIGNSYIYVNDDETSDYIEISSDGTGGLYGDGNLVLTRGYRYVGLNNYGSQYHTLPSDITTEQYEQLNDRVKAYYSMMYKHKDTDVYVSQEEYNKMSAEIQKQYIITNKCMLKAGRMMNTLQRADKVVLRNTRMVMLGAQDKVPEVADFSNYSVNRVDTIECESKNSVLIQNNHGNYFGIYNVTNLLGSFISDVQMSDKRLDSEGHETSQTYYEYKKENHAKSTRNQGTSPNEVAIANGAWLTIEHLDNSPGAEKGAKVYGPVYGVFQLSLLATSTGEGGGYVYAKNIHGETADGENAEDEDEIQTSGNFVHANIHVVDNCFPTSNNVQAPGHFWYLKGDIYVYNLKVSAFTGTSQAYNVEVILPMLQLEAELAGRVKLNDIRDNYYCIKKGEYNKIDYDYNSIISAYEYSKLTPEEQTHFVSMTYVKKSANLASLQEGDVISSDEYDALSQSEKDNYNISNCVSTKNGFVLTGHLDNPKGYTYRIDKDGKPLEPRFIFKGIGGDQSAKVLGQRSYKQGEYQNSSINQIDYDVLQSFYGGNASLETMLSDYYTKSDCNSLAVFEKAYISKQAIRENYYDVNGNLIDFIQPGAGIGQKQYEYNQAKDASLNASFEPAFICKETLKLSQEKIYPAGSIIGAEELNSIPEEDRLSFDEAYICTRPGKWGGHLFEYDKSYPIIVYADLKQEERDMYQFDYNCGELNMLDLEKHYDFKFEDPTSSYNQYTNCYNKEKLIDFEAKCKTAFTSRKGKTYTVGKIIAEEEFDQLYNEKSNFYNCYITDISSVNYICVKSRIAEGVGNSIGTVLDPGKYEELTESEKSRYLKADVKSFPQAGRYYFTKDNSGYTSSHGTTFNGGEFYYQDNADYKNLIDEKQYFSLSGDNPTASFLLYVPRDATLNQLRKNRIVTLDLSYSYEEYDSEAGGYSPRTERYIVNVEVDFKSGAPEIGDMSPLPKVIPGSSISLQQPLLTQGAYVIESTGWEISSSEDFRTFTECSPNTPVYWYQDGYYIRFYAVTYLGKTTCTPQRLNVANYHRMNDVFTRSNSMFVMKNSNIYIDGLQEFKQFRDYFTQTTNDESFYNRMDEWGNIFNPKDCEGMNFFMQANVDLNNESWSPIGTDEHPFKGNFHGNGARISNLTVSSTDKPAGLFGVVDGNIYNLGVQGSVTGSDYVGGIAGKVVPEKKLENCWFVGDIQATGTHKGALVGGPADASGSVAFHNCYYNMGDSEVKGYNNETSTEIFHKSLDKFANGEVAYYLNSYYLNKRLDAKLGNDSHKEAYAYIDNLFIENDNNNSRPWDWTFVHCYHATGKYSSGSEYYSSLVDRTSDSSDNNIAFYDPSNKIEYTDYILFGQFLDKDGNSRPGICNKKYTAFDNRVYRGACYRGDKEAESFYHNSEAKVWESDITAVDFTGACDMNQTYWNDNEYNKSLYIDRTKSFYYPPLLDPIPLESYTIDEGITRNMLTYASNADQNSNEKSSYDVVWKNYSYTTTSPEMYIYAHSISYSMAPGELEGSYQADMLHLVNGETFNAPIAFTAENAWYDRKPSNYVNAGNDAWSSIALPFTAQSVEAYMPNADMTHQKAPEGVSHGFSYTSFLDVPSYGNGSMTHFYGKAYTKVDADAGVIDEGKSDADNVGHQYWLRTLTNFGQETIVENPVNVAYFSRPKEDDSYGYEYKDELEYEPTCEWYWKGATTPQSQTFSAYPYLTSTLPYIVSFPGSRYYEFDLSGNYQSGTKVTTVGAQAIEYAAKNAEIGVSDDMIASSAHSIGNYTFKANFDKRKANANEWLMNEAGTAFVKATADQEVNPFDAVLVESDSKTGASKMIRIAKTRSDVEEELKPEEDTEPQPTDKSSVFRIEVKGHEVIVTSSEKMQLPLYQLTGILSARWNIQQGVNRFRIEQGGVYILNGQKIMIIQ